MDISNKDIMHCFPLLASVLANRYGVKIVIEGYNARTDGNTIFLPIMTEEPDDETMIAVKGYVDHESAHIRFTDFQALQIAKLDKLEHWLFNAIEDWRVENRLAAIYPGCRHNFRRLIIRYFAGKERAGYKNPALSILDYVLLQVRAWDTPEVLDNLESTRREIEKTHSKLLPDLDVILADIHKKCANTQDAIAWAEKLAEYIRAHLNNGRDLDNAATTQQKGNSEGDQATGEQSGSSSSRASMKKHLPDNSKGAEDQEIADENRSGALSRLTDLDKIMEEGKLPDNLGEALENQLECSAGQEYPEAALIAREGKNIAECLKTKDKTEALRISAAMRKRLSGLLQSRTLCENSIGRRGKLDAHYLHRLCSGNAKVFRRRNEQPGLDTAVHILMDCSYSMSGHAIQLASQACYAIASSLYGIKGINLAVTAFPAKDIEASVMPVFRHGQKMTDKFSLGARGDTPLGPAVWWAMSQLLSLKEKRKSLFIITDGVPNSVKAAEAALAQCKKMKIETYGLGIMLPTINYLIPDSKWINSLDELAPAMFSILQEALGREEA